MGLWDFIWDPSTERALPAPWSWAHFPKPNPNPFLFEKKKQKNLHMDSALTWRGGLRASVVLGTRQNGCT